MRTLKYGAVAAVAVTALLLLSGCAEKEGEVSEDMAKKIAKTPVTKTLTIIWQRLLDEKGATCDRCGLTEQEMDKALAALKSSLGPLGILVALEKKALDAEACAKDISESNRIWIGGQTLEDLLGAQAGMSPCDSCCTLLGDNVECRTVVVDGRTYEAVPADLIVRAGLVAGSRLLAGAPVAVTGSSSPCCGTSGAATSCAPTCSIPCDPADGAPQGSAKGTSQCCPTPKKAGGRGGQ